MSTPKHVFLVQGSSGQYEEHEQWIACAFLDRAAADAHAANCEAESERLLALFRRRQERWEERHADDPNALGYPTKPPRNRLDRLWSGSDTDYDVVEVEVRRG